MHEQRRYARTNIKYVFPNPLALPYILPSCWEHLPSPQVLLGLAQYRRADDTTVIRNGTCMVCDNTVVDCSLVPHCSHLPPPREIRGMDLAHVNLLNAPSWPSQGLIRDIAAPGNHTQLGGISPRSNIPVHARHAVCRSGTGSSRLNEARSESRKGTQSPLVHRAHVCEPRRLTCPPDRP